MGKPAYLLLGPNVTGKKKIIASIADGLKRSTGEDPDVSRYYLSEDSIRDVIDTARSPSLFVSARMLVVYEAEAIRKADSDLIAAYLKAPDPHTALVFLSEETKVSSTLDKLFTRETKQVLWNPFESDRRRAVISLFRTAGVTIAQDAVDLLLELAPDEPGETELTCRRLLAMRDPSDGEVGVEDVERLVEHTREETPFSVFDYLVKQDLSAALAAAERLFLAKTGTPVALLVVLQSQAKRLRTYAARRDEGVSPDEAASLLKIPGKILRGKMENTYRSWSREAIEHMESLFAAADIELRSTPHGLETTIVARALCGAVAGPVSVPLRGEGYLPTPIPGAR